MGRRTVGKRRTGTGQPTAPAERSLATRLKRSQLDLLPILHELLRTRSVSETARSLGISQPAVSQSLRRLRSLFGDALLVPLGRELRLTERATKLIGPLQGALGELDALLRPQDPFDPAKEELHVVISIADYVALLLAPILAEIAAIEARNAVFEFVAGAVHNADDLARVDFMIGPRAFGQTLGKRIGAMPLWQDDVVCIVGASNRTIPGRITPEAFRQLRQAAFQRNPAVSETLRKLMQPTSVLETRRVCTLPDFLVLGAVVEKADCVALVPRKVANELLHWRALRIVELAYANRHLAIDAYWSLAADARRGHAWCRSLLVRAAQRIEQSVKGTDR